MNKLLLNEPPLQVLPTLAKQVGINEAIILQQLHYWLGSVNSRIIEGTRWVYNTYQQWQRQFPWLSERTIRRMITHLEEIGLIVSANHNTHKTNQTKWYTLNYDTLALLEANTSPTPAEKEEGHEPHAHGSIPSSFMASSGGRADPFNRSACPYVEAVNMAASYTETTEITTERAMREDISNSMVEIWNRNLQPPVPVSLTPCRSSRLKAFLAEHCQGKLEAWERFCQEIRQSSFLMGQGQRGWRITLDWILESHNFQKVREGNYRNGQEASSFETGEEFSLKAEEQVKSLTDPLLQQFCRFLLRYVPEKKYLQWFSEIQVEGWQTPELTLIFPALADRNYVQQHFSSEIYYAAEKVSPQSRIITYDFKKVGLSSPSQKKNPLLSLPENQEQRGVENSPPLLSTRGEDTLSAALHPPIGQNFSEERTVS